ncbi:TPA: conjugal transfer protein TraJ [Klebsiella pneumoniae]|nr:conjugal transfer protein TraJ [Klebsiella pneumoniae]
MYPMDRKEKDTCRQSLASSLQMLIMSYSFPACIHTHDGFFPAFNPAFLTEFGNGPISDKYWEAHFGVDDFLHLREIELILRGEDADFHIEKCVYMNDKQFDFTLEKIQQSGEVYYLWKFGRSLNTNEKIIKDLPMHNDILHFMKNVKELSRTEFDFLGLYSGGASHNLISQIMGCKYASSRNAVSEILKKLKISNRDDAFLIVHLSELAAPIMKGVKNIIIKNVNNL